MFTAIVIDDIGSPGAIAKTAALTASQPLIAQTIIISSSNPVENTAGALWITEKSLVAALKRANAEAISKRVLLINSALSIDTTGLSTLLNELENRPAMEQNIFSVSTEDGALQLPEMAPEEIARSLGKQELWPFLLIATNRSAIGLVSTSESESIIELLTHSIIRATADGDAVRRTSAPASIELSIAKNLATLSAEARARALSIAVDAFTIEELFAAHDWSSFSQEAAAASYHTLAALFLRFGDTSSAIEALNCSERLEESPRYFALKGLIQQAKGETLGAVANLVSSLQCYESRKINNGKHYLTFKPQNLEVINSRLVDGLDALNRRDNARALTHFSEAVFNFDPFYADYGVRSVAKGSAS
jgi:hypothetical protein